MKVKAIKTGGLAISPRENVYFRTGEILAVGDKGLYEENLKRLIELELAELISDDEKVAEIETKEVEKSIENVEIPEAYDFEAIENKEELETYARDVYDVELDKRKSLANMKSNLKLQIEGDK